MRDETQYCVTSGRVLLTRWPRVATREEHVSVEFAPASIRRRLRAGREALCVSRREPAILRLGVSWLERRRVL